MNNSAQIDFRNEELLALTDVPTALPSGPSGRKIHIATVHRWASRGLRGVVLETTRIGGRRFTSYEALQRFFYRLDNPRAEAPRSQPEPRIEAELDRHGL